jgi:hypothetical protein
MKKTSVYLTAKEYAALQRAAHLTGRTQSDLIREGVRKITMAIRLPGVRKLVDTGGEWFTREEEQAFILKQAGHSLERIAQELRISAAEAKLVLERGDRRWNRMLGR